MSCPFSKAYCKCLSANLSLQAWSSVNPQVTPVVSVLCCLGPLLQQSVLSLVHLIQVWLSSKLKYSTPNKHMWDQYIQYVHIEYEEGGALLETHMQIFETKMYVILASTTIRCVFIAVGTFTTSHHHSRKNTNNGKRMEKLIVKWKYTDFSLDDLLLLREEWEYFSNNVEWHYPICVI